MVGNVGSICCDTFLFIYIKSFSFTRIYVKIVYNVNCCLDRKVGRRRNGRKRLSNQYKGAFSRNTND